MEPISIFLPFPGKGPPTVTHQEHKIVVVNGKPRFYDPPRLANARATIMAMLEQYMPDAPCEGPVKLIVKWCFAARNKNDLQNRWHTKRPDTDNLIKLLKDCLTKTRFWIDDSQVASESISKVYVEPQEAGIRICIYEINKGQLLT